MSTPLSVWAPLAATLEIELSTGGDVHREAMDAVGNGWWRTHASVTPGTDYAYVLDGSDPLPDPRSRWQPHGVHGPSRALDPSDFTWTDGSWAGRDARGALTYELHVGTFTPQGTLDAAIERLDHLTSLGVEMVELMPLAAFNGTHGWGYDGVALYAVHEPYGGPHALARFVDAAHARGLAVCLDVVYNHLGPSGNYLSRFGPYFTDRHETPWGSAVNLDDDGSTEVRAFLLDNARWWLRELHVDALRLDAVHALADASRRHLLAELSDSVADLARELGRPLSLVAESDLNDPVMVTPTSEGGLGMTAQWDDDVHHAIHVLLTGERDGYYGDFAVPGALATVMRHVFLHDGTYSTFRGQTWGAPVPEEMDAHRFVVCSANHDQIGNRAAGDRLSASLPPGALAQAAALVLCSPYTPMLFMGEEWGATTPFRYFTDHPEPELAAAVSKGRREEFSGHGWDPDDVADPQDPSSFAASVLVWEESEGEVGRRLLAWHRGLAQLRHEREALANGDRTRTSVEHREGEWLVLRRAGAARAGAGERGVGVAVVCALSDRLTTVPLPDASHVLLSWGEARIDGDAVVLPGHGVAVVELD